MTISFLQHIYHGLPDDLIAEFAIMAPSGRNLNPRHQFYHVRLDADMTAVLRGLWIFNTYGYGIHYGLTVRSRIPPRGHRNCEDDAAWCSVLWCDVDFDTMPHGSRKAAFEAIQAFQPAATAIVHTGGGYQVLWRIEPVSITDETRPVLRHTLRGLALALGGDVACAELSRLFRLPGTFNTKPSRHWAMCELVGDPLPLEYHLDDFAEYTKLGTPPPADMTPLPEIPLADGVRLPLPRWVEDYLAHGRPEGQRNRTLFGAAIECKANGWGQGEAEALLLPRALADGLDEQEARRTIASAYRSTITGRPNVPRHIAARLYPRSRQTPLPRSNQHSGE